MEVLKVKTKNLKLILKCLVKHEEKPKLEW